jgi:hypothetical protein
MYKNVVMRNNDYTLPRPCHINCTLPYKLHIWQNSSTQYTALFLLQHGKFQCKDISQKVSAARDYLNSRKEKCPKKIGYKGKRCCTMCPFGQLHHSANCVGICTITMHERAKLRMAESECSGKIILNNKYKSAYYKPRKLILIPCDILNSIFFLGNKPREYANQEGTRSTTAKSKEESLW